MPRYSPISFGDSWQNRKYNRPLYLVKNGIKNTLRSQLKVDELVWFLDQFSTGGYYHWLTEILPRLWIANEVKRLPLDLPTYFPEYFFTTWTFGKELLVPFGRKYKTFPPSKLLKVKQMHFISQSGGPLNFQPEPLKMANKVLRDYYYDSEFEGDFDRIYISRNRGNKRLLLNEKDIIPVLENHGFKIVYTEDLNIKDQINIFSRAKCLVSIHGAGLTNMVFMPTGSRVLEIRNALSDHMNNCFLSLADTVGHDYYYCIAKLQKHSGEIRDIDASLEIDNEDFSNVLLSMLETDV
jgi:capsular polysaccharide biosynthesis protein